MSLIFDAHLDLAMNAMEWNRDLTLPVNENLLNLEVVKISNMINSFFINEI